VALVKQVDGKWKPEPGQRIRSFSKAWKTACRAAGYPDRLIHDLRRSAIRTFIRSGISQSVAMQLSGQSSANVFERYNITAESDLDDAAAKLDAAATTAKPAKRTGHVRQFRRRA
jgi:integrase